MENQVCYVTQRKKYNNQDLLLGIYLDCVEHEACVLQSQELHTTTTF